MKRTILILLLIAGFAKVADAQRYPFRTYSIEEGLSESVVNAIAQDEDGYMWLATGYGLNRFDGIRIQNFFEEDGLNNNKIESLYKDSEGKLWIGTQSGINYFDGDTIRYNPNFDPLLNSSVICIFEDSNGEMWFGTDGNGIWHYYGEDNLMQYTTSHGLKSNRVRAVAEDKDGTLWLATRGGVTILREGNFRTYTKEDGLPADRIRDVVVDSEGIVWVGSRNGLVRFEDYEIRVFDHTDGLVNDLIRSITVDPESGGLWIGTEDGVSFFDGENFQNYTVESGLSNNIIYSTEIDREGNIWFGTYGGGVNLFLGRYFENFNTEYGLPNNLVTSITQIANGDIWIGTYGGGVTSLVDGKFNRLGFSEMMQDNQVYELYTDSKERTWVGMREGLAYYHKDGLKVFSDEEFPYRKVRNVMETSENMYWISTYDDGIVRYDGKGFELFNEERGLADNTVLGSVEADDGSIWIATYGGISRFKNGEFQNFSVQDGLPHNAVMYLLKDDEDVIWASTFGGISWFDGTKFQSITPEDGLPDRVCYFIEQSRDGFYWIGTTNGIVRFDTGKFFNEDPAEQEQAFQLITMDQGLVSDELNLGAVYEDNYGHLWFGTVGGVSHFLPENYRGNPVAPEVHILGFRASGREYGIQEDLSLSHDQNFVEINFSGINFSAPEQVIYEYRMSGIDPDWQRTTDRVARYPSLPPGDYTFRVHARNTNGAWSQEIDRFSFEISAPFWMQWWFVVIVVAIIIGIIMLFYNYYRVRKMVDIERMRVRIASDLHDDVGASLTEIALQSDFLQAGDTDTEFKQSLNQIGKQCRKIVSSLDDIVWSIDARNDTMGDLTDRMQDYILNTLEQKDMEVRYDFDDLKMENKLPVPLKENLYLIFKEAVNNIAKYSNGNKVEIIMTSTNGSYEFTIFDNGTAGRGLKKTGHGLRNMEMRAKRIGADIDIKTEDGFRISINGHFNVN